MNASLYVYLCLFWWLRSGQNSSVSSDFGKRFTNSVCVDPKQSQICVQRFGYIPVANYYITAVLSIGIIDVYITLSFTCVIRWPRRIIISIILVMIIITTSTILIIIIIIIIITIMKNLWHVTITAVIWSTIICGLHYRMFYGHNP